ncbi:MAG: DEAD/DEAH box helicase, partial [Candidatus Ranarchaeia archaeon]
MIKRLKTVLVLPSKKANMIQVFFFSTTTNLEKTNPLMTAHVYFHTEKKNFRPWKIDVVQTAKRIEFGVREFLQTLRSAQEILIYGQGSNPVIIGFTRMLKDYQIKSPVNANLCRHCLTKNRFTELKKEVYYYHNEKICRLCAKEELKHALAVEQIKTTPQMLKRLSSLFSKVRSVDKIVTMFKTGFDPGRHPEITLFDTLTPSITQAMPQITLQKANLHKKIKQVLEKNGIKEFTPIQVKALQGGITEGANMLVVAPTTTGKTLVGELGGITNALQGKKMIYLSPLVALANQKYEEFKNKYSLIGLRAAIKVGMNLIDIGEDTHFINDTDIENADLVAATYEAFDVLLRNGEWDEIGEVGTVVIDEVQMLGDLERGPEIDGLIGRIRLCFPKCQIIALSATIGNPDVVARELGLKFITHADRPIPLDRHLLFARNDLDKIRHLANIIRSEYKRVSRHGFHGQSIVFTYSRKKCTETAKYLRQRGINAVAYHGGLTYQQRKQIEMDFDEGRHQAVITTAALGAGVDFPASQVVFLNLIMGNKWLTVSEFEQFQGRAGRLGKHDRGQAVVLVSPDNVFYSRDGRESETEISMKLLSGKVEDVDPTWEKENLAAQILAGLCTTVSNDPDEIYNLLLGRTVELKALLKILKYYKMIEIREDGAVYPTPLGRATAVSYLNPTQGYMISSNLSKKHPLDLAISLET